MKAMNVLKKMLRNEEGFALPAALALLLIGGFLVVPASLFTGTSLNANRAADELNKSIYAADAGIEYALWQIKYNSSLVLPTTGNQISLQFLETLNGKNLTITIDNLDGTTFRITSITTGSNQRNITIVSDVDLTFTGGTYSSPDAFNYALASLNGNITLSGNTEVEADEVQEGDIYANGNVSLSGNAEVNGDASATGTITTSANARITGTRTPGATPLSTPTIDTASYENETLNHSWGPVTYPAGFLIPGIGDYPPIDTPVHVSGGNLNISRMGTVTFNSTVYVEGDLIIGSTSTVVFNGAVYVTGAIFISSNTSITFGSTVHVGGNFTTSGNAVLNLGGTVYIEGAISMSGNSNGFSGGHTVIAEGNITLTGNSQLAAEEIPFIMSTNGTITLAGNNWTSAIMYAPVGTITLSGNSRLYGSAVGQSIAGSGNSKITYPVDLRNRDDLPGGETTGGTTVTSVTPRTYSIQ